MAFTPVVVSQDGKPDRVARTAIELVQFEHDGFSIKREASKALVESGASAPKPKND